MKLVKAVSVLVLAVAASSAFANVDRLGRQSANLGGGANVTSCAQNCHVSGVQGRGSNAAGVTEMSVVRAVMFSHASAQEKLGRS
jgi:hypothetical protein